MPALEHVVGDGEREARPAGAARAEALAGRDRDALLGEQPVGGEPFGQPQPDVEACPRRRAARAARPRAGRGGARRSRARSSTESCGPSSAAIAASCSGANMPTREWSLSRLTRSTISALPTTKPIRQPAMPNVFDIVHISTPTSFAPGVARKLSGSRPSKTRSMYAASCDDRGARALGVGDRGLERAGRRADRARVRRVVEERGRRGPARRRSRAPSRRRGRAAAAELGAGERDAGRVVGVAGIREQDRVAALRERRARARRSPSSCRARPRPRAPGRARRRRRRGSARRSPRERAAGRGTARSRGRPGGRPPRAAPRRRAAAGRPRGCRGRGRARAARLRRAAAATRREQRREVLRRQPLEPVGARSRMPTHPAIVRGAAAPRLGKVPPARAALGTRSTAATTSRR